MFLKTISTVSKTRISQIASSILGIYQMYFKLLDKSLFMILYSKHLKKSSAMSIYKNKCNKNIILAVLCIFLLEVSCFSLKEPTQYSVEEIDCYELICVSSDIVNSMDKLTVSIGDGNSDILIGGKKFQIVVNNEKSYIKFETSGSEIDQETITNKELYEHQDNKGMTRIFVLESNSPKPTEAEKKDRKIKKSGPPPSSIVIIKKEEDKLYFQHIPRYKFSDFFYNNKGYKAFLEKYFGFTKLEMGNLEPNIELKEIYKDSSKQKTSLIDKKYDFKSFKNDMCSLTIKDSWQNVEGTKKSEFNISDWDVIPITAKGLLILCKSLSKTRFFLIPPAEDLIITPMKRVYEY